MGFVWFCERLFGSNSHRIAIAPFIGYFPRSVQEGRRSLAGCFFLLFGVAARAQDSARPIGGELRKRLKEPGSELCPVARFGVHQSGDGFTGLSGRCDDRFLRAAEADRQRVCRIQSYSAGQMDTHWFATLMEAKQMIEA